MTQKQKYAVSVLLPTRGRRDALKSSIMSLVDLASDVKNIELLLAFDDDDRDSSTWFQDNVVPELENRNCSYTCFEFPRLGYIRLNEYINGIAKHSQGDWLMFWGDDALMLTKDWDLKISAVEDFRVVRIPTHKQHPYAIFPIVPRQWYEVFGYMSAHQLTDSWVSQIAYMLDIMHNVDIEVIHDRYDITGNNNDETFANRPMLEGNINDPRDFNHIDWRTRRLKDSHKLAQVLEAQGQDMSWFRAVIQGQQDPWEKMISPEYDPNHQVSRIPQEISRQTQ